MSAQLRRESSFNGFLCRRKPLKRFCLFAFDCTGLKPGVNKNLVMHSRQPMNRLSRSVQSPRVLNIEDLRRRAKRRLPRVVFDYIDGGAEDESTLRANCRAFESVTLRPRCAVATPMCDLRTTVLGTSVRMPLILAPVGSCRLMFPRGEEAVSARRRRSRNHLYAFDTFGMPARTCRSRIGRAGLVPTLSCRRSRLCFGRYRPRAQGRLFGLGGHNRHASRRFQGTRPSQWRERTS